MEDIKLSENVVKFIGNGNCYLLEGSILIDTSRKEASEEVKEAIKKYTNIENIKTVILTHLHYDHTGNVDVFPNAKVYAGPVAVEGLKDPQEKLNMILKEDEKLGNSIQVKNIFENEELTKKFYIIETPGHCKSCISFWYEKENVFFTGDTYFSAEISGRIDLPSSVPEEMPKSLEKTQKIIDKHNPIIAAGHDY